MSIAATMPILLDDKQTTTPAPSTGTPVAPIPQPVTQPVPTQPKPTTLNYDPNLPVYAEPQTANPTTQLGQLPSNASYVDENNTVQGRMTGLLADDSDYMKLNVAKATAASNARGLLNTSMAGQAGRAAAINAALPIAQQDAGLFGDMSKRSQQTTEDSMLNNQLAGIEYQKSLNNARITGALTQQEQAGQAEIQKLADTAQMQRLEVDNKWKELINFDQMDSEEAKSLLQVSSSLGAELTGGIERLLRDPNIADKTAAAEALMTNYRAQMDTAAAMVNIKLTWF